MVAAERQKSLANVHEHLDAFAAAAARRGLPHHEILESCPTSKVAAITTAHARVHDVTIIPIGAELGLQQYVAESVIFGSGRPTLIVPEVPSATGPSPLDVIGVAWDFSRAAARAVADSLPLLKRAKTVRVVTITQEKEIDDRRSGSDLVGHLARHGIEAVLEAESAGGRPVGRALEEYAATHRLGLLVMGAYGHSRLRDFMLGGATKTVIAHPKLPVLLSH
jgi:nucleotide-binding universal stress UspA family protein